MRKGPGRHRGSIRSHFVKAYARLVLPCALLALAAGPAPAQSWLDIAVEVDVLAKRERFADAAELGPDLLQLAAREFGETSEPMAESHLMLAEIQIALGETFEAERNILAALEIHEGHADSPPARLMDAYRSLGDIYQSDGEHELALGAYSEVRSIGRRKFGLFNLGQVEILRKMADSAEAMGDSEEASALHREALDLVYRAHGARSIEAVEANRRFADWLSEHERYLEAGDQYSRAIRLLWSLTEQDPLEVVQLLHQAADNYFLYAVDPPSLTRIWRKGPAELISALNIVQPGLIVSSPQAPYGCIDLDIVQPELIDRPLLTAEILRDIGDWCVALDVPQYFENAHVRAWNLLSVVENGNQIRHEWFAAPMPVYLAPLRSRVLSEREDAPTGRVELEFVVDEDGMAEKIEVVASDPEGLLDRETKRRVRNSRFRPRIEDGELVSSTSTIAFEFRYEPELAE